MESAAMSTAMPDDAAAYSSDWEEAQQEEYKDQEEPQDEEAILGSEPVPATGTPAGAVAATATNIGTSGSSGPSVLVAAQDGPEFDIGNQLGGFRAQLLHQILPDVFARKPFQVKRKAVSQSPGMQGAMYPDNRTVIIFLRELCSNHKLVGVGMRKVMIARLVHTYYKDPSILEPYVLAAVKKASPTAWGKAVQKDANLVQLLEAIKIKHDGDTMAEDTFPPLILAVAYHAKRSGLYPKNNPIINLLGYDLSSSDIDFALDDYDTSQYDASMTEGGAAASSNLGRVIRRTKGDVLRLFVLLFVVDSFYDRLLNESKAAPLREELDRHATGGESDFWVDVCAAYNNDDFPMPSIPINHSVYMDSDGNALDISKCTYPMATSDLLKKWYNTTHNVLVTYKNNQDKSGQHDFSMEGLEEFVRKFSFGQKDVEYLALLACWRGDDALEWFSGKLPSHITTVDGFGDSRETCSVTTTIASSKTKDPSEIDRLIAAMTSRPSSGDSPQKRQWYKAKTSQIKSSKKAKARAHDLAFARNLFDASQSVVGKRQKKMKAAAGKIFDRLLLEVDLEIDNADSSNASDDKDDDNNEDEARSSEDEEAEQQEEDK